MATITTGFHWFVICLFVAVVGCGGERGPSQPAEPPSGTGTPRLAEPAKSPAGDSAMKFKLTSSAFQDSAVIPRKFTGEGDDVSPALAWEGAPEGTQEFALICDDPDAPTAEPWVHWVIYGIAPELRELPEGIKPNAPEITGPVAARQGMNSWDSGETIGYRGPMPPPGHGTHHYHFKLYALDQKLDVPAGATKVQLLKAMEGHILGEAELVGTYERKR